MLRRELNYFATQELFGVFLRSSSCSWYLYTSWYFEAVGRSRFLILALSNPGIKSIKEEIPGGEHFLTVTLYGMIQTGFRTCMAPAFSHGYAGLLVFSSTYVATSQHPFKPEDSWDGQSSSNIVLVHIKTRYIVALQMTRTGSST